ncbi:YitT family protein [Tianweitania sp. BSSL-BM11]|uniref:YitT family protein n=1 Tax=Tianweitania aestuarii TaxID=2814886 RepID=A0ABS5RS95_9HYPH|nr:YitT family protein [Tianweitania aestuarii]MBS9719923.1 YitT family protein [Tianweitania aestuarii]
MTITEESASRHRLYEDVLALLIGTGFAALGLTFYTQTHLTTGSAAGLALLLQYMTGYGFGTIFFVINLPFYAFAVARMGWPFAVRTFIAVVLISAMSRIFPLFIGFSHLDPLFAAFVGGGLQGMGLLILARHRTGLGGFSILALYLQDRYGIRAGYFQLAVDLVILLIALTVLTLPQVVLSVIGAVMFNMILAINHRPGRYVGMS